MPRLRLYARDAAGKYEEVALEPRIGSQGTTRFCVDPLSNDVYVYDSQEHVLRHWRPVSSGRYALHGTPIPLSPATGRDGPVVAVVARFVVHVMVVPSTGFDATTVFRNYMASYAGSTLFLTTACLVALALEGAYTKCRALPKCR